MRLFAVFTLFLALFFAQTAPTYYVAPYGNSSNDGSSDNPKTLAWATSNAPQDSTIWLIPGTYKGTFTNNISGATYRSVPGTRAKIDGAILVTANDVTWRDVELFSSWSTARNYDNGSQLYITGERAKIVDSYIHDLATGIGFWKPAINAELRGNLIYNNGYNGTNYNIYAQNISGQKTIDYNVIGASFGQYGLHAYSSASANAVHKFTLDHNVFIHGWVLLGGNAPTSGITLTNNIVYSTTLQLGYTAVNTDVTLLNNTFIAPSYALSFNRWKQAIVRNNVFITTKQNFIVDRIDVTPHTYDWDYNTWRYGGNYSQPFGYTNFAAWQASGVDTHSSYTPSLPTQNVVTVWPSGVNHGIIAIQNWTNASTVTVTLDTLSLTQGATYRLVNAQNPNESQSFVAGDLITIDMNSWTVAIPIGAVVPLFAWDSRFAAFLVTP